MNKNLVIGNWEISVQEYSSETEVRFRIEPHGIFENPIFFMEIFEKFENLEVNNQDLEKMIIEYVKRTIFTEFTDDEEIRMNEFMVNCVLSDTIYQSLKENESISENDIDKASDSFIEKYGISPKYKTLIVCIYTHAINNTLKRQKFMKTVSSWQEAMKELCNIDSVRQSILHNKYLLFGDKKLEELSYAQVIALLTINADGPSSNQEIEETIYNGYNIDSHLQMDREGRINYTTSGGLEFGVKKVVWSRNVEADNCDFIIVVKNPGPGFPDSTLRKKLESEGWKDTHKTIWDC